MDLVDKPFKEALRELPIKRLSWWTDRGIKKMIRQRAMELEGRTDWSLFFKQLVAVPAAFVILITAVGGYAYASPTVVKGDFLHGVKTKIEVAQYPREGSSEERIAYHLWLSGRRYAEVNEILKRLGKTPLAFIPGAFASNGVVVSVDEELSQFLLETLQDATQHVDYAFLISDEIRDVGRVKAVREEIRGSLEIQNELVKKVVPALKELKMKEKRAPRVKGGGKFKVQSSLRGGQAKFKEEIEENVIEEVSVDEQIDEIQQEEQVPVLVEPELEESVDEQPQEELADLGSFLEDRLAFQDGVLDQIDEAVLFADTNGNAVVQMSAVIDSVAQEQETEVSTDDLFREALAIHYEFTQELLEGDLRALEEEQLIAEVPEVSEVAEVESSTPVEEIAQVPVETEQGQEGESAQDEQVSDSSTRLEYDLQSEWKKGEEVSTVPESVSKEVVMGEDGDDTIGNKEAIENKEETAQALEVSEGHQVEVQEADSEEVASQGEVPLEGEATPQKDEEIMEQITPAVRLGESDQSTESVVVKTPSRCEKLMEERCPSNAEQKECSEKVRKECEEEIRKEQEKKEAQDQTQQEIKVRVEEVKREIEVIGEKVKELRLR